MITETDYRTTEIGEVLDYSELRLRTITLWGGVAWPSKRPGFAVVVAMEKKAHLNSHDIFLLDEYESFDTRLLVRQIGALDAKYGILRDRVYYPDTINKWIGDNMNAAADRFIAEMNAQNKKTRCRMTLSPTMMTEMNNVYSYLLPQIKDLLNVKRRRLFIKGSKIIDYLSEVEEIEIADFKIGEYPAIEALGFTIIEMRNQVKEFGDYFGKAGRNYKYNYDPLNARNL